MTGSVTSIVKILQFPLSMIRMNSLIPWLFFQIIYKIKGGCISDEVGTKSLTVQQVCDRIFQEVDINSDGKSSYFRQTKTFPKSKSLNPSFLQILAINNSLEPLAFCAAGQITLEEFVDGAQRSTWLQNFLRLDVNPSGWVQRYLCDRKLMSNNSSWQDGIELIENFFWGYHSLQRVGRLLLPSLLCSVKQAWCWVTFVQPEILLLDTWSIWYLEGNKL